MRIIATLLCTLVVFSFLAAPGMSEEADSTATAVVTPDAECDHTVRIAPSGIKFSPATLTVNDGDTVCWQWTNESMAHNVVETAEEGGTEAKEDGLSSGYPNETEDFRVTFTGDQDFTYVCEPHATSDMVGIVTVGEGDPAPASEAEPSSSSEDAPGFAAPMAVVALVAAAMILARRE
ncbi:MAG: plastocyanin/azurin family copper-binding protein [Candidatus Thermoplasmatota archaeon]|nr:plastocyanin/azurin family copper-binding protein [Candidatus Thermoplasmatota archaeon]MEC8779693.1 plastocyanin/azurin family copper-binding protein [Candidatus Thermoplasmatota archaeon]